MQFYGSNQNHILTCVLKMVSKVTDLSGISRYCSLVKHREFKGYYDKPKCTPFLQCEYTIENNLKIATNEG